MPDRIHVMTQSHCRASMSILVNELIVELNNVFGRIERLRAVRVQNQMRQRLVREEVRLALQFNETLNRERPIQLLQKQQKTAVHRVQFLGRAAKHARIGRAGLAIGQIIRRRVCS